MVFPPPKHADICVALDDVYASSLILKSSNPHLHPHSHSPLPPPGPTRSPQDLHSDAAHSQHTATPLVEVQWREYDLIDWDRALKGTTYCTDTHASFTRVIRPSDHIIVLCEKGHVPKSPIRKYVQTLHRKASSRVAAPRESPSHHSHHRDLASLRRRRPDQSWSPYR